ncbi:MAG: ABC transporter substrate-binding protein [Myxococcota bacterium]
MSDFEIERRSFFAGAVAALLAPPIFAQEADRPLILVLTSDTVPRSAQIAATFKKSCDFATRISYQIGDEVDAGAFIADNIRDQGVSLVFAVGPLALKIATREFTGTPIVFSEVTEIPQTGGTVVGVSTRLDPQGMIERLKKLHPGMTRIGLLHGSAADDPYWVHTTAMAGALGLKPVVRSVTTPEEVENAFKALLSSSDLVWIQQEPRIWTATVLSRVFHEANLQKFPVVSFSRTHLEAANPPAIVAYGHPDGVAQTAAQMARQILLDEPPPLYNYVTPMLVGHMRSMRSVGMTVSAKTAELLDELITK